MPELPEVETIVRALRPRISGRVVTDAWGHGSPKFQSAVLAHNMVVLDARRRSKFILVSLARPAHCDGPLAHGATEVTAATRDVDAWLVVHLGMTGRLEFTDVTVEPHRHCRAWWSLEATTSYPATRLCLVDARRFGRALVVPQLSDVPALTRLGPEPLDDFDDLAFARRLTQRASPVKTLLLSGSLVAGVGNIYADEALWRSRVHPLERNVSVVRGRRLAHAIVEVLTQGVKNRGTTLRDYKTLDGTSGDNAGSLACYGRAGLPCFRCCKDLQSVVISGRTSTFCPRCQRLR